MPRFAIAINGQNHVFEGPNADAATRFAQQWARDNPQAVNAGRPGDSALGGYVDTFNRAVPGLSEMGAGIAAGGGVLDDLMAGRPADFGARWSQARAHQQSQIDQLRSHHPIAANMTTGLGLAAPLAAALATGGTAAAPVVAENAPLGLRATAARLAANTGRNAFTGAAVGGVYGASQPGTVSQRFSAANQNMLPGAVAGVAAPALVGATRAGLAGVRALTSDPNAIPSALALAGGALQRLPTSEDALYNASVNGIDGVNRAAATRQIPWSANERLLDMPRSIVAAPDDEFAASDRLQNKRIFQMHPDLIEHFQSHARDYVVSPITDDPDFKGYTGFQVAGIRSRLSDLADHYRPQGQRGTRLANEIDQMNADFTAMAGRTQPAFARALTQIDGDLNTSNPNRIGTQYPFARSDVESMLGHLPLGDTFDLDGEEAAAEPEVEDREPNFMPPYFKAAAANDNFPKEDEPRENPLNILNSTNENNSAKPSSFFKLSEYRSPEDQHSKLLRLGREYAAANRNISTPNDNIQLPLEEHEDEPNVTDDPVGDAEAKRLADAQAAEARSLLPVRNADVLDFADRVKALSALSPTLESAAAKAQSLLPFRNADIVSFAQRRARAGLDPTLERPAAQSPPYDSFTPGPANAFTGVDSDSSLAAAIATRAPRIIDDTNFGVPGLNVILPLAAGARDGADPSASPRDQQPQ